MSVIIKVIIGILVAIVAIAFLVFVYDIKFEVTVLFGLLGLVLLIVIIGYFMNLDTKIVGKKNHDMKSDVVMQRIKELWLNNMGAGNTLTLFSGGLCSVIWDDEKKYWAGVMDATGGAYNGSHIVLIYCADDDDFCYINPTPSPNIINNPFHNFEPKKYSLLLRKKIKAENYKNKNVPLINMDIGNKPDKKEEERENEKKEFDKTIGK